MASYRGLIAGAWFLLWNHRRNRLMGGHPTGNLIAADNEEQECPVLVSERYGLKGKPDALVRTQTGVVIPIERKRARAAAQSRCSCRLTPAPLPPERCSGLPRGRTTGAAKARAHRLRLSVPAFSAQPGEASIVLLPRRRRRSYPFPGNGVPKHLRR